MMEDNRSAAGTSPAIPDLVDRLRELVAVFEQARQVGLSVTVPEDLYRVCAAIVEHHDHPGGTGPGTPLPGHGHQQPDVSNALQHVPLRQLIFEVITPGEPFSVSDVVQQLKGLGIDTSASAVSNALGFWVTRGRLVRHSRGIYQSPIGAPESTVSGTKDHTDDADRKESVKNSDQIQQKKAV